jgi:hypothetical protein
MVCGAGTVAAPSKQRHTDTTGRPVVASATIESNDLATLLPWRAEPGARPAARPIRRERWPPASSKK